MRTSLSPVTTTFFSTLVWLNVACHCRVRDVSRFVLAGFCGAHFIITCHHHLLLYTGVACHCRVRDVSRFVLAGFCGAHFIITCHHHLLLYTGVAKCGLSFQSTGCQPVCVSWFLWCALHYHLSPPPPSLHWCG